MKRMQMTKRAVFGWLISILAHAVLFLIAFPTGGAGGNPAEVIAVSLVEIPAGTETGRAEPDSRPAGPPAAVRPKPATDPQVKPASKSAPFKPAVPPAPIDRPADIQANQPGPSAPPALPAPSMAPPAEQPPQPRTGAGAGSGLGSGEEFVVSSPVSYPKSAENEGVEGRVGLAVYLTPGGKPHAVLVAGSGDARLDRYALRAVAEAWSYQPSPVPVRIRISLVFRKGRVEIEYEGCELAED